MSYKYIIYTPNQYIVSEDSDKIIRHILIWSYTDS